MLVVEIITSHSVIIKRKNNNIGNQMVNVVYVVIEIIKHLNVIKIIQMMEIMVIIIIEAI